MRDNCVRLSKMVSESEYDEAREYCQTEVSSEVSLDEYGEVKARAREETEIWGNESEYWMKILPLASDKSESEWKFVLGNYLLAVVKECKTDGEIKDDTVICSAAHELFSSIHFADRHKNLALTLYHQKLGHLANSDGEFEAAIEHFGKALRTLERTDGLGGWHHHAVCVRDFAKAKAQNLKDNEEHLDAVDVLENKISRFEEISSPTSDEFKTELEAEKHKIRAEMADIIGEHGRKERHLRKYEKLNSNSSSTPTA